MTKYISFRLIKTMNNKTWRSIVPYVRSRHLCSMPLHHTQHLSTNHTTYRIVAWLNANIQEYSPYHLCPAIATKTGKISISVLSHESSQDTSVTIKRISWRQELYIEFLFKKQYIDFLRIHSHTNFRSRLHFSEKDQLENRSATIQYSALTHDFSCEE